LKSHKRHFNCDLLGPGLD